MNVAASVFKAYDVRGLYPSEITEDLFHQLGRAFVAASDESLEKIPILIVRRRESRRKSAI